MLLNRISIFFYKKNEVKSNKQTYVLNVLQWLSICATGKLSNRLTDIASDRSALIYSWVIIAYKMLKLFSEIKNTTIIKEKLILMLFFLTKMIIVVHFCSTGFFFLILTLCICICMLFWLTFFSHNSIFLNIGQSQKWNK